MQKDLIIAKVKELIRPNDGKDSVCLMCSPVRRNDCKTAMVKFVEKSDWTTCEAFLKQHSKQMIALYVGLLPHCLELVTKQVKFG